MVGMKINQRVLAPNLIDRDSVLPSGPLAGISIMEHHRIVKEAEFVFSGVVLSIPNADDFGNVKICDLPATNILILGAVLDLAIVTAGLTVNTAAAVDMALGTVPTASVDFSNAGEDSLIEKMDGVGATPTGTMKGASASIGAGLGPVRFASGAKPLHLNASSAVAAGTGTVTITGHIRLFYIDLGVQS